jgi:hypothetical protein
MMRNVAARSIPFLALAALSASARSASTLIDFNTLSGTDNGYYADYADTVLTNGYLLQSMDLVSWKSNSSLSSTGGNYTGSTALFSNYRDEPVVLTQADGGAFNLYSIDIANLFTQSVSPFSQTTSTITFTGLLRSGGTVTQLYTTTADDLLHTVNFSSFNDLTSVSWVQEGMPYHQFDNVTVSPTAVPEPGTIAVLGLGALGLLRRRRRG